MRLVILYRWRVDEAHHEAFRVRWAEMTEMLRAQGGLGSCLTRNAVGEFVAIALWPDESSRDQAFESVPKMDPSPGVRQFAQEKLHVDTDLWSSSPFSLI